VLAFASLALLALALAAPTGGQPTSTLDPKALSAWLVQDAPPLLLDTRGRAAYLAGTILGALDAGTDPAGYLPDSRGGNVVLILESGADPASWTARLAAFGYQAQILAGGLPAWRAAGLPVVNPEASFARPGSHPFVIPRGLCEMNTPADRFD
jgi:rhodanese-related sulfurtransferase